MSNPTSSSSAPGGPVRHTLRTAAIVLVALLLLAGGGWWANQAGLLNRWLPATAQTASSVAAGVQAAPAAAQADTAQADPMTTPGAAGGPPAGSSPSGTPPAGFPSGTPPAGFPPRNQTPGQASGAAGAPAADEDAAAATTAPAATATPTPVANIVTIPAVAGVKGSAVYDGSGSLLGTLASGDSVLISGRSDDGVWLAVTSAAGTGWTQASELIAYGLQRLPEVTLPGAVAALSTTLVDSSGDSLVLTSSATTTTTAAAPMAASNTVTSTDTAAASPSHSLTATVVTDDGRLNLRAGPGTGYAILAKGENGDVHPVLGRNAASDWLQLQLADGGVGWASITYLEVTGDTAALPVQEAAAEPVATPQPVMKPAVQATAAGATTDAAATDAAATDAANDAASDAVTLVSAASTRAADGLAGTLVFQQNPGGIIYAYNLQTGNLWPLTNGFDPAISPDGSTVAFVRDGGETGLYLIDIDGGNERRIFERSALSSPKWSPDGQWIVFTRNDEGVECYQMGPKMCILPEEAKKRFPMGVPDTMPLVTEYQYKLSVVDLNGDNYHDAPSLNSARAADWSDAGIVYQSSAGIQITADAEGATTQEVAFNNLNPYYYDPDLQGGGAQVVFQIKGAAQTDLWVVNTDGAGLRALTQPKTTLVDTLPSNVAAAYSPDGQYIVFLSNRTDSGEAGEWHLWVMGADGSNQRQLPVDVVIEYTYGDDQVVSWGA